MTLGRGTCHENLRDAIRGAVAPCGIAYRPGKGWFSYDLLQPDLREGDVPDFAYMRQGTLPLALHDNARDALASLLFDTAFNIRRDR